jgi:DNA mismatch repair ATPase MutS
MRHFCIFDELYSGTNPVEATKSAYAFMQYLTEKFQNVDFLLTTHYVEICDKIKGIRNYRMEVIENEDTNQFEFTYKIEPGISRIEGAIKILEEMDYPADILNMVRSSIFV